MGNRCSDVNFGKGHGADKPLDASSSEEGSDEEEDEEEDEEDGQGLEDDKAAAETELKQGLKRGRTATFGEALEHAISLGIDGDKIKKAEEKLEEHKNQRRREVFEQELHDFLESEECGNSENCEQKVKQGRQYGVSDKVLKPLLEKIEEFERNKDLDSGELARVQEYVELAVRKFTAACMAGRTSVWVDLQGGSKKKATLTLTLTLKDLLVKDSSGTLGSGKIAELKAKFARDVAEVTETEGWAQLKPDDQDRAVAIIGAEPWCFVESSFKEQHEFVVALSVLSQSWQDASPRVPRKSARKKSSGGPASPRGGKRKSTANKKAKEDADADIPPQSARGKKKKPVEEENPSPPLPPPEASPRGESEVGSEAVSEE